MPWKLKTGGFADRVLGVVETAPLRNWEVEEVATATGLSFSRTAQVLNDLFRKSRVGRVSVRARGHGRSEFTFHLWNEAVDSELRRALCNAGPVVLVDELSKAVSRMSVGGVFRRAHQPEESIDGGLQ